MHTVATETTKATGYSEGLRSLETETRVDELPVEGKLPGWLQGSLIRTGPAKWEVGERKMRHWFDGFAMLHRFGIADGKVSYANRFLQSKAYRAAEEKGEIVYAEFATDPCRSLFQKAFSLFDPKISDNANVNLVELGERFITMTETPMPVQFDGETLDSAAVDYAWDVPGLLTTAHPHLDRATRGLLNYTAKVGARNKYRFFRVGPEEGAQPEILGELPVKRPAYMHSFGLTERWFVLVEFPYVVNPISIPLSGRPYIENYKWKPELGTKFTLFERTTGEVVGPFETDAWFGFHHVNAYEDGDDVVVDISVFQDAQIVEDLYMERLLAGKPVAKPEVRRFRIEHPTGNVTSEKLFDEPLDLPRINYGRCNERPYRYTWGVGFGDSGWLDSIVKADVEERTTIKWAEQYAFPGEPVFVARPGDEGAEDEGVLLSVVFDGESGGSYMLVLDAQDLSELARAEAPHHIPFGFHGQFARS